MTTLTACITTYNRWTQCLKALTSLCGQKGVEMEVILVDDYSTDPMPDEVMEFIEQNQVSYIRHDSNKGLAAARNSSIEVAIGKYFSFCDDDDQWPPGMAWRLVQAVEDAPPEVGMGVAMPVERKKACHKLFADCPCLTRLMLRGFTPPVSSQIYKTELVREVNGYNPDVKSGVDHDLWISLAKIDPRVAVAWGEPVIVGEDPARKRMTTDEQKRRSGIAESLEVWKPKLIEVFGHGFYEHFCYSYQQYMNYAFFKKCVQDRCYLRAGLKFLNPLVVKRICQKLIMKNLQKQQCNLFPAYNNK